ncbi:metal ABC transporter ATP-binding protein [bacterium]|nr:metal ABC transporter ATP-binding protein [bacterium]
MQDTQAVRFNDVWVSYRNKYVLEDITFSVGEREIFSVVGPNGGGKTTLLHTLLGLKKPARGTVTIMGKTSASELPPGTIAFLPQMHHHDRTFPVSVSDVVAMGIRAAKRPGQRYTPPDRQAVRDSLALVSMEDHIGDHFGTLSGGQQQRVLIARALAMHPRLLVMDEPSTGLDAVAQDSFYQLLQRLRDSEGLSIVFVSHDVGTVSGIVDQIACLNRRIHFHGNPRDGIPASAREAVFGKGINFLIHDEHCKTCRRRR